MIKSGILSRALAIKSGDIDEEKRTVDLSFSSEEPVDRYFGVEILDHKKSSVDLSRLKNGASVLVDHDGDQVGVVEDARIGDDRRGYARLRFGKSNRASEVFQDIVDGIRKNISFGYRILKMVEEKTEDGAKTIYRAMKWMPLEISSVSVPADATIGIGRSEEDEREIEVEEIEEEKKPLIIFIGD